LIDIDSDSIGRRAGGYRRQPLQLRVFAHHRVIGPRQRAAATPPKTPQMLPYNRDAHAIYRESFAIIRAEADLSRIPPDLEPLAVRVAHACGMPDVIDDLVFSDGAGSAGRAALQQGAALLCDGRMSAEGITRARLPADNAVICTLQDPRVPALAKAHGNTRTAAALELWREHLAGAVVVIGNAPTALFRLLEMLDDGAPRPALILGFPVGFVGAAESKAALAEDSRGVPFVTVRGRRGGSAMAAAAVNALGIESSTGHRAA
jgi:precorrin-8X/cobalt-precorrin-8 methylmutase